MSIGISKRELWRYTNKKIKRLIHHYHVFSILSILFDEMIKDLQLGKEIKIFNFGTIVLKDTPPRKYHNVKYRKMMNAPSHKILRIFLAKPIRKKLCENIDLDIKNGGD